MVNKERFKIIVKDLKTGDVDHYFVHELGFQVSWKHKFSRVAVIKMVLDFPRIVVKKRSKIVV